MLSEGRTAHFLCRRPIRRGKVSFSHRRYTPPQSLREFIDSGCTMLIYTVTVGKEEVEKMSNKLGEVLRGIGEEYREDISATSGVFLEVDIGGKADKLGYADLAEKYRGVEATVPLKHTVEGMKVMIDGRTFVGYGQLESGVIIPGRVAKESALSYKPYRAPESIVRTFG